MTLTLPYPPSTNTAYAVMNGRKIKTARARQYAAEVTYRVIEHKVAHDYDWLETGPLAVHILVFAPDHRRRDLANIEKLAVDAVFKELGFDDSRIDVLTLRRQPIDRTNPRVVVTLEAL
jgi:crossover junction endodeoxyribonuclease RusA